MRTTINGFWITRANGKLLPENIPAISLWVSNAKSCGINVVLWTNLNEVATEEIDRIKSLGIILKDHSSCNVSALYKDFLSNLKTGIGGDDYALAVATFLLRNMVKLDIFRDSETYISCITDDYLADDCSKYELLCTNANDDIMFSSDIDTKGGFRNIAKYFDGYGVDFSLFLVPEPKRSMFYQYNTESTINNNTEFKAHHIQELYYILPINNLENVMKHGILSHKRAAKFNRTDISDKVCQNYRATKILERVDKKRKTLSIHRHAVLYINPHNAMMYVKAHENICVVRIHKDILQRGDAVISTENASTRTVEFHTTTSYSLSPKSADYLVNSKSYFHDSFIQERKRVRQSEVLLPYEISPIYFTGIMVKNISDQGSVNGVLEKINKQLSVEIVPSVFFQNGVKSLGEFSIENAAKIDKHKYPDSSDDEADDCIPVTRLIRGCKSGTENNVTIRQGNLLESTMQTIINPINCVGAMGRGLALEFKQAYPVMFADYEQKCRKKEVKIGIPYLFKSDSRYILNFPTKDHWIKPSKIEYIEAGLKYLSENYIAMGITSLAIPKLGCGNGGLNWEKEVWPLINKYLLTLDIPMEVYTDVKPSMHEKPTARCVIGL